MLEETNTQVQAQLRQTQIDFAKYEKQTRLLAEQRDRELRVPNIVRSDAPRKRGLLW